MNIAQAYRLSCGCVGIPISVDGDLTEFMVTQCCDDYDGIILRRFTKSQCAEAEEVNTKSVATGLLMDRNDALRFRELRSVMKGMLSS